MEVRRIGRAYLFAIGARTGEPKTAGRYEGSQAEDGRDIGYVGASSATSLILRTREAD